MDIEYSKIQKKIEKISEIYKTGEKDGFFQNVICNIFLDEMGYKRKYLLSKEDRHTAFTDELAIRGSREKDIVKLNRELILFEDFLESAEERNGGNREWGIFIYPAGMCLVNTKVEGESIQQKKILEIIYGQNSDQKYFKYFSYENILGYEKNTYFYKDIISYKNTKYKGTEKSWYAYSSTLKRFFDYYVEVNGSYACYKENVYDRIQFSFFRDFIRNRTKAKSLQTIKNEFFHVKEMMCDKASNGEFERSTEELIIFFPEFALKRESYNMKQIDDYIDEKKIRRVLDYLTGKRNELRNKAVVLLLFAYGFERRRLCSLEWNKNVLMGEVPLLIEGKEYPMPTYLREIIEEYKESGRGYGLVFENDGKPLNEGTFNGILSNIGEIDREDKFYNGLSPANIRKWLAKYLLWHGYPLERIFYLMDITGNKLSSYITDEEITEAAKHSGELLYCSLADRHPLEDFFEKLR